MLGFGENNENILEVLADSLIPSVSDNEDDSVELASDSESFSSIDDNLSEAFISLENAYSNMDSSQSDTSLLNSIMNSSHNAEAISNSNGGKECTHCKCQDKVLDGMENVTYAENDQFTKAQFEKHGPADVILMAGDTEIPCHKEVIRRCSEYFEAMFDSQMIESTQEKIELKEVNLLVVRVIYLKMGRCLNFSFRHFCTESVLIPRSKGGLLEKLIKFAYCHQLSLDVKSINEVMTSARMLQFHEVTSRYLLSSFVMWKIRQ